MKLLKLLAEIKMLPNSNLFYIWDIWTVSGRTDSSIYVRAETEEEAIEIAKQYADVEEDYEENLEIRGVTRVITDKDAKELVEELINEKNPEIIKLLNGEITGFLFSSGT